MPPKAKHYTVLKTYHCDISGEPCAQTIENLRWGERPPDCSICAIAQEPEPSETRRLYSVITITPGKGFVGKTLAEEQK
jgi:hypothetical protein